MLTTYLRGEIDLSNVAEIREQLQTASRSTTAREPLIVDCTALTFLGSCGITVLCEIRKTLRAQGRDLTLVHVSPPIRHTLDILGLADIFGLPEAGSAGPCQDDTGRADPAAASS